MRSTMAASSRLVPVDPLRQVGDHGDVAVGEPHRAGVLAGGAARLGGLRAVLQHQPVIEPGLGQLRLRQRGLALLLQDGEHVGGQRRDLLGRQVGQVLQSRTVVRERAFGAPCRWGMRGSGGFGVDEQRRERDLGVLRLRPGDGDVGEEVGAEALLHEMHQALLGGPPGAGGSLLRAPRDRAPAASRSPGRCRPRGSRGDTRAGRPARPRRPSRRSPSRSGGWAARVVVKVVCFMDIISLLCSYSRRSRTVSRRPRAMSGQRAAQIAEAAVEGRAGAEATFGERADRALRGGRAERAVAGVQGAEGPGEIDAGVDRRLQRDAVAMPGGQAVGLAEPVGERRARRPPARPATASRRRLRAARGRPAPRCGRPGCAGRCRRRRRCCRVGASKAGRRRIRSRRRSWRRSSRSTRGRRSRRRRRAAAASASSRMVTRSGSEIGGCIARRLGHRCRCAETAEDHPPFGGNCVGLAWEFRGKAEGGRARNAAADGRQSRFPASMGVCDACQNPPHPGVWRKAFRTVRNITDDAPPSVPCPLGVCARGARGLRHPADDRGGAGVQRHGAGRRARHWRGARYPRCAYRRFPVDSRAPPLRFLPGEDPSTGNRAEGRLVRGRFRARPAPYVSRSVWKDNFLGDYPAALPLADAMFFAHEMTHIWQWQHRKSTGYTPWRAASEHILNGDPYLFDLASDRTFADYGFELQASLVEEFVCCRALDPEGVRTERLFDLLHPVFPGLARNSVAMRVTLPWAAAETQGICGH